MLNHLEDYRRKTQKNQKEEDQEGTGFPEVISKIETNKQAEILMQALGPNLSKLIKQCPGKQFSKISVYMITIQLVSNSLYILIIIVYTDLKNSCSTRDGICAQRLEARQYFDWVQRPFRDLFDWFWTNLQIPKRW